MRTALEKNELASVLMCEPRLYICATIVVLIDRLVYDQPNLGHIEL